jgi:hypothetical protein
MAEILISRIDTDCTTVYSVVNPVVRKKNVNRVFAIAEGFSERFTGTLEVNLTPGEQELFNELTKRIVARVTLEVSK